MNAAPPPRSRERRIADARAALEREIDCWVASADGEGRAHLVPLSHLWDGERLLLATLETSRTMRDLTRVGATGVGFGSTRDVVMVDADVCRVAFDEVDARMMDAFAARHDWDPRTDPDGYGLLLLTPTRIQAWRQSNELSGRTIMRHGRWLA